MFSREGLSGPWPMPRLSRRKPAAHSVRFERPDDPFPRYSALEVAAAKRSFVLARRRPTLAYEVAGAGTVYQAHRDARARVAVAEELLLGP